MKPGQYFEFSRQNVHGASKMSKIRTENRQNSHMESPKPPIGGILLMVNILNFRAKTYMLPTK